jgi:superfamily II DNA helicase RecQ
VDEKASNGRTGQSRSLLLRLHSVWVSTSPTYDLLSTILSPKAWKDTIKKLAVQAEMGRYQDATSIMATQTRRFSRILSLKAKGQRSKRRGSEKCSCCKSDAVLKTMDFTPQAQAALKIVQTMQGSHVTLLHCMDILRGVQNAKIKKLGHDTVQGAHHLLAGAPPPSR